MLVARGLRWAVRVWARCPVALHGRVLLCFAFVVVSFDFVFAFVRVFRFADAGRWLAFDRRHVDVVAWCGSCRAVLSMRAEDTLSEHGSLEVLRSANSRPRSSVRGEIGSVKDRRRFLASHLRASIGAAGRPRAADACRGAPAPHPNSATESRPRRPAERTRVQWSESPYHACRR
jgi:hypothetical protein